MSKRSVLQQIIAWCMLLSCYSFVFPPEMYAVEENLDRFFEDYFSEDLASDTTVEKPKEETKDKSAAPVIDTVAEQAVKEEGPVAQTPAVVAPVAEEPVKTGTVASPEPQVVQERSVFMQEQAASVKPAIRRKDMPAPVLPTTMALRDELVGASYLDSYIDQAAGEQWQFDAVREQSRLIDRDTIMDRTVDLLIGQEVERPVIEIKGPDDQPKPEQFMTLKECVIEALKNHLPIDIAREKVIWYRRRIRKSVRDMLPQIVGTVTDSDRRSGGAPDAFSEVDDVKVLLRQPIYSGGLYWNKVREEKANLKTAMGEYQKIFSDLTLEVATAYFNLAKAKTMLKYREELLTKAKGSLTLSEEKYAANLISEIENLNVQSQESQLRHNMEQAKEDIELAMIEMQKSLNLDLDNAVDVYRLDDYFELMDVRSEIEEAGNKEAPKADEKKIDDLIKMAYENRPEFVIGENKVKSKKYAEKAQKAKWLPQWSLYMEAGKNRNWLAGDATRPKFGEWEVEYNAGVECSWNIGGNTMRYNYDNNQDAPDPSGYQSGGKGNWAVTKAFSVGLLDDLEQFSLSKEAEIAHKEAILEFQLSEKDMVSEVKESYYNYNRAKIQMRSVLKKIEYRRKLVELARHRSEINEIQVSEYLQSEIDLVEERNTLYQAMIDYFIAKASLNKAIGVSNFFSVDQVPSEMTTI